MHGCLDAASFTLFETWDSYSITNCLQTRSLRSRRQCGTSPTLLQLSLPKCVWHIQEVSALSSTPKLRWISAPTMFMSSSTLAGTSELRSQYERPIHALHRISVELVQLANHPCVHSCLHAMSWRACHALDVVTDVSWWTCPQLWMAVANCSGSLDSTWLFTHAVPPAVHRVRFIPAHDPNRPHQHTCNHVCFFTHLLLTFPGLSLTAQQTSVRHPTKFTAPPLCDCTCCHAPNTHLLCNKEGLNHDTKRSQTPLSTAQKSFHVCAFRASHKRSEILSTDCRFRNQRLRP